MFYSLQGEGAHTGRPAIFLRFSGCNLWNGKESDRENAICSFCDTDFIGTDGQNGGKFSQAEQLVRNLLLLWPTSNTEDRYVILTGGEPALQVDSELIDALHAEKFEIGIETNGTKSLPTGIDWVCISPKGKSNVILTQCDELKLVYPQIDCHPNNFSNMKAKVRYLSPLNPHEDKSLIPTKQSATDACIEYCLVNPQWRLCLQTHKILNID